MFTSNRHPDQLYENGLNRSLFVPFIAYLKSKCHIQALGGGTDAEKGGRGGGEGGDLLPAIR